MFTVRQSPARCFLGFPVVSCPPGFSFSLIRGGNLGRHPRVLLFFFFLGYFSLDFLLARYFMKFFLLPRVFVRALTPTSKLANLPSAWRRLLSFFFFGFLPLLRFPSLPSGSASDCSGGLCCEALSVSPPRFYLRPPPGFAVVWVSAERFLSRNKPPAQVLNFCDGPASSFLFPGV